MTNREAAREILEKALTPGTVLHKKAAAGKLTAISDELCGWALNEWDIPTLRKCKGAHEIGVRIRPWLVEFWKSYSEDRDAEKAINGFLDHIEWPPSFAVYTHLPPQSEFNMHDTPSDEKLNRVPAHFTFPEKEQIEQVKSLFPLMHYKTLYEKEKNPLILMRAFLAARNAGVYPPQWILDKIADVFNAFLLKPKGERSNRTLLHSLFGFHQGNKFFEHDRLHRRDDVAMFNVYRLSRFAERSIEDACGIEARRVIDTETLGKEDLEPGSKDYGGLFYDIYMKKGWANTFNQWDAALKGMNPQGLKEEVEKEFSKYLRSTKGAT